MKFIIDFIRKIILRTGVGFIREIYTFSWSRLYLIVWQKGSKATRETMIAIQFYFYFILSSTLIFQHSWSSLKQKYQMYGELSFMHCIWLFGYESMMNGFRVKRMENVVSIWITIVKVFVIQWTFTDIPWMWHFCNPIKSHSKCKVKDIRSGAQNGNTIEPV